MPATAPHILLTVTNDLSYDQRMHRIAGSLAAAGYKVTLIGRELPASIPLEQKNFTQERLRCRFHKGKLFYTEFNWKLYKHLAKKVKLLIEQRQAVALCAIDLDTILPVHRVARKYKIPAVYDAHELFSELTEVKRRPVIHKLWLTVEQSLVPQFHYGYTVNQFIADELERRYRVKYGVIRNMPRRSMVNGQWSMEEKPATDDRRQTAEGEEKMVVDSGEIRKNGGRSTDSSQSLINQLINQPNQPFFLYQGAVNEGRSFETLIPAMKAVDAKLLIAGDGNFFEQATSIVKANGLEDKVLLTGYIKPGQLKQLTPRAYAGITIFENSGLNQYYSLANRYFDYINAGIPQLCVNYPEYAALNKQFETALLTDDISPEGLAVKMNLLLHDTVLYKKLTANCEPAARVLCWEEEEKKLVNFWQNILPVPSR